MLGWDVASIPSSGIVSALSIGLEIGPKRKVFAQVVDWPGWCRAGRDEATAIAAVESIMPRYRAAIGPLGIPLGSGPLAFTIMERIDGSASTDFGAPDRVLASDRRPLDSGELHRLAAFLDASWAAFDAMFAAIPVAERETRPPVGRGPSAMREHVMDTTQLHLSWLLRSIPKLDSVEPVEREARQRELLRSAVLALPLRMPFASEHHPGPFALRRECWHALDHAWELENRFRPS
jgi:hypothetical protein